MRRIVAVMLLCVCVFSGCEQNTPEPIEAVGRWVCDQSSAYYFELYDNGTCMMFDEEDMWVSEGTYQSTADQILFEMDTGSFSWSKREDGMVFETAGETLTYRMVTE